MKNSTIVAGLACLLLVATLSGPANAGFDIDFGASVRVGNNTDLYLAVSSRYFERDRAVVQRWSTRYRNPDHLAVSLFISNHSGVSLSNIYDMRQRGLGWWDISVRCGVPRDVWFVPVSRDPGPPYGKAYGYHKKHGRRPMALTDADMANLVAVRMLHEYYSIPVEAAMERRSSGRPLMELVSDEYGRRHGRGHATPAKKHRAKPAGKAKGNGKHRGR